ncbi:hypothetical protein N7478_002738 [Penicillium angulare]|uniref:uncharacterized protein n=1 Tax=Penicillium angulare TaxID=116970 RepID=UPI00254009C7|nr:uncharacterized protein N7478_002738 [Penicillium angulare]KAJ5287052.1 hypothetical protein N7478_002738 [Penicillium angulare]
MSSLANRVREFNRLRRPEMDDIGTPNHYIFSVISLPKVPGNAVFVANPYNGHYHYDGRARITPLAVEEQAKIIVPILLEIFNSRFDSEGELIYQMNSDMSPWAPNSWGTADPALARAVSNRLTAFGVHREMCEVKVADKEQVLTANTIWRRAANELLKAMGGAMSSPPDEFGDNVNRLCEVCGFTPSLDVKLLSCARCKKIYYCTKACQKLDWPMHKPSCVAPGAPQQSGASTSTPANAQAPRAASK